MITVRRGAPSTDPIQSMYTVWYCISYLNGVLPLGKVDLLLPLSLRLLGGLVLGHTAADGTGVLGSEVEREVLLVLVEQAELRALVDVDHGEDTSDGLADVLAITGEKT